MALNVINLTVNGRVYTVQVEPNWTLAKVLREKIGLTGTNIACNQGACGACTVHVDGKPVLSCLLLAVEMEGKSITTIEGLADSTTGELHPVQEAFIEKHGLQCGFCTSGMIMSTKALLDKTQNPSEEDIRKSLSGNICRCGNYTSIVESGLEAARKMRGV
ncbi:MAG: (2Fe-2S)-binding protein [Clostridia bacterium]|nr:(2Fe-2S)-binding protein [Clostridia bacterium]